MKKLNVSGNRKFYSLLSVTFILSLLFLCIFGSAHADVQFGMSALTDSNNRMIMFSTAPETEEDNENAEALQELLDTRFLQNDALRIYARVLGRNGESVLFQTGNMYQNDDLISLSLIWNGEQANGIRGSKPYSLCLQKKTWEEISLSDLFLDPAHSQARLEEVIETEILPSISDYLEYAELLPMPTECFGMDASGLTVYYDGEHYQNFSGTCGAVHFAWFEIADMIDPDGPAAAFIRDEYEDATEQIHSAVQAGTFGDVYTVTLGKTLQEVSEKAALLPDADYTRNAKLYLFEEARLRGFGVEIPKYTDTAEMQTKITAIRAERIDFYGLKTGWTGRDDILDMLGEPVSTLVYDEQMAEDMMMEPGESLLYQMGENVLEAHLDEEELLSVLILRDMMPEI